MALPSGLPTPAAERSEVFGIGAAGAAGGVAQLGAPLVCRPASSRYNTGRNCAARVNACRKTDASLEAFRGRPSSAAEHRQFTLNATLNATLNRAASTDRACLWRR